jgi:hypothetical protein
MHPETRLRLEASRLRGRYLHRDIHICLTPIVTSMSVIVAAALTPASFLHEADRA